jgi:hypothetical protein
MSIEGAEWFSYAVLRHAVPALSVGSAMFLASRVGQVRSVLALLHCPFPGRHLAWLWCTVRFLVVFWLFWRRVLVGVQIVAYVDVDAGHTWAGHFLTEGSMACIATCKSVFGQALPALDLDAVVAFSGTFDAAERFVVV